MVVVAVRLRECQWCAQCRATAHRVGVLLEDVAGLRVVSELVRERLHIGIVVCKAKLCDRLHGVIASYKPTAKVRLAELDKRQTRRTLSAHVDRGGIAASVANGRRGQYRSTT